MPTDSAYRCNFIPRILAPTTLTVSLPMFQPGRQPRARASRLVLLALSCFLLLACGSAAPSQGAGSATTPPSTATPGDSVTSVPSASAPAPTPGPTQLPGVALGAFIPGAPSDPRRIDAYASLVGAMPRIVMWFQPWSGTWNAFYAKGGDEIRSRGAMPMISWEPWAGVIEDRAWSLRTIVDGDHDAYIRQWTGDVAAWGHPIYVRLMYEMNGSWSSWSARVNGNSATLFVAAWRHIVDLARDEGATNVRWLWSPNVTDERYTPYAEVYPGDDYVDWVGLTGYNWGDDSLYDVFSESYDEARAVTSRPMMIVETGTDERPGKPEWIRKGFAELLSELPEIRALVWYNGSATGKDWRVNSSSASLAAFRGVASSPEFAGTLP
jgi:Glycosyl hydrolase family 26